MEAMEAVEAGLAKECQLASRPRQAAAVEAVEAGLEAKECQLASRPAAVEVLEECQQALLTALGELAK